MAGLKLPWLSPRGPRSPGSSLWLWCMCLVIAAGFGLRVAGLDNLPFGLSRDEAINGLDALQLSQTRWLTPFLQNNFGRETLFFYIQSVGLALFGISIFSLRFASVVVGTLTLAPLFLVGRRFGSKILDPSLKNMIGLLAAAGLALSYWHLYFSRLALRAILLPLLVLVLVWCFWQGWTGRGRRARWWLAAAGCLLGLSFHTYLAARVLPLLFLFFVAVDLLVEKGARRDKIVGFLIFCLTAAVTSIPMGLYFWHNPQAFGSRTQSISVLSSGAGLTGLVENLGNVLYLQALAGWQLGQWPTLNLVSGLGLIVGLVLCVRHIKQSGSRFLLLWWVIGWLPMLLSEQNWDGTTVILRSVIAWPAVYIVSAIGLAGIAAPVLKGVASWGGRGTESGSGYRPGSVPLVACILLGLLVLGNLPQTGGYFLGRITPTDAFLEDPVHTARYLNDQDSQPVLVPTSLYAYPSTQFLALARYPALVSATPAEMQDWFGAATGERSGGTGGEPTYLVQDVSAPDSSYILLVPGEEEHGVAYLLPPLTRGQRDRLSQETQADRVVATVANGEGKIIARAYALTDASLFAVEEAPAVNPILARFDGGVRLTGYGVEPPVVKPGQDLALYLTWEAGQPIDGDYDLFIHLFRITDQERQGQVNTSLGNSLLRVHRWPVDMRVPTLHYFDLAADAPEGVYLFEVGLYHRASGERLPVAVGESGEFSDDKVLLGKFRVDREPGTMGPVQYPAPSELEGGISLLGVDVPDADLAPDRTSLSFVLHWQALAPVTRDYTVFAHLVDSQGQLWAQQDNMPQNGQYPTSWWSVGETVPDPYTLQLPSDLPAGDYRLRVGMYDHHSGQRLPITGTDRDYVELPVSIGLIYNSD